VELTFAVYSFENPTVMATKFAPLLASLEESVARQMRRPVRVDCRVYRSYSDGHAGLLSRDADFMRVGPSSYVLMKEAEPGITLLAAQDNLIKCEIFTRTDSGINSLGELKGADFAFGDPESTFGTHLAKVVLRQAGLRASDLGTNSGHFSSHTEVLQAVMSGRYAAGSANRVVLDDPRVKVLHEFDHMNLRMPFVARAGLDPAVVQALRQALLRQHTLAVLTNIVSNLRGFVEVADSDYDPLRQVIKEAEPFGELENRFPPSSNSKR